MGSSNSTNASASFVNYNGECFPAGIPLITADNRGFRYGDGLFETMLLANGHIRLEAFHFDRLFSGVHFLQYEAPPGFTREDLAQQVRELCQKNDIPGLARVRLVVFRGEGGLSDLSPFPNYIIQAVPLSSSIGFNETGLDIGIFPDGQKACDSLSNLKSNNYLLYALAALHARKHGFDDNLVLNTHGRIADTTIANLFYIRSGEFYTPPLSEGGVDGVMRRYLLDALPRQGFRVHQLPVDLPDLAAADEVFLTNALKGINWVRSLQGMTYGCNLSSAVYNLLIQNL
jgi:branched-chain amino acid aminotransferase